MAFEMSLIDRREREWTVSAIQAGNTDTVGVLSFAALRTDEKVSASTVWKPSTIAGGVVKVVYAGPAATAQATDLGVFPNGTDVYMREVKGDLVLVTFVEQVSVT